MTTDYDFHDAEKQIMEKTEPRKKRNTVFVKKLKGFHRVTAGFRALICLFERLGMSEIKTEMNVYYGFSRDFRSSSDK